MHKIITPKTLVIITMVIVLLICLCTNFIFKGDISVFKRATLV